MPCETLNQKTVYHSVTLEHVYMMPHGDEILERSSQGGREIFRMSTSMGRNDKSDTIVIISPHGLRLSGSIAVINTEYLHADLLLKTLRIRRKYRTDRGMAGAILKADDLTQEAIFVTSSGPKSAFPLDFGSVIPLYFFGKKEVVAIGQPRIWNHGRLISFGRNLARVAMESRRKVSILISADQAHTHSASGPYGYSADSEKYENMVEQCITASDLSPLVTIKREIVENAKPDSYWNMIILKGIMDETGLKPVLDYHYVEDYFGMMLAHLS